MARVKLNSPGVAQLLGDPGVAAHLAKLAAHVESAAQSAAPTRTGVYRASIRVESDLSPDGRARARVVALAPHALRVEASYGVLARALDAAGGS